MNEYACGVCSKPVRSDASLKQFCAVCGMGVRHGIHRGDMVFCGQRCFETFKNGECELPIGMGV